MERIGWGACEKALRQCHEIIETFEGSKETLQYIRGVQEALRRIVTITNQ